MEQNPTEDSFLKDVAQHEMSVLLDNEIYRHVRFSRPGTNCYSFELITGPGYLLYRGDMGCFEFERMYDMFEFFSSGRESYVKQGKVIPINLNYWAEKLEAVSSDGRNRTGAVKVYCPNMFRAAVMSYLDDAEASDEIREEVFDLVLSFADEEQDAYRAVHDFESSDGSFRINDFWEADLTEYTYHYVWCCYAISWGIMKYDKFDIVKAAA